MANKIKDVVNYTLDGTTKKFNPFIAQDRPFVIQLSYTISEDAVMWLELNTGITDVWDKIDGTEVVLPQVDTSMSIRDIYGYPYDTNIRLCISGNNGTIHQINYIY